MLYPLYKVKWGTSNILFVFLSIVYQKTTMVDF